jgi:TatD DNase family protein
MPNIDHTSVDAMLEVEHKHPASMRFYDGTYIPCSVKKDFEKELYKVEGVAFKGKVCGHWRNGY